MSDYLSLSDEELVVLCNNEDENALAELTKRYIPVSALLAGKIHDCPVEKDDLIQEGMIGFLSAVSSYSEGHSAKFRTYAGICIRNRISNAIRAFEAKRNVPADLIVSFDGEMDVTDYSLTPEEMMISKNEAERVSMIIESGLTEKEKTVFRLYVLGNSYKDICDKTGMSVKSVDGTLQRARKKLKNQL